MSTLDGSFLFPLKNLLKYHNLLSNAQFVSVMVNVKWAHFLSYSLETFGIFYFCNSVTKTGLGLQLCRLTLPVTRQDFPGSSLKAIFIQFLLELSKLLSPYSFFSPVELALFVHMFSTYFL